MYNHVPRGRIHSWLCESMRFFEYSFVEVVDNFPLDKFFRSKRAVGLSISSTLSTGHWKNKSSAHAARWDLCQGVIVVPHCTGPTADYVLIYELFCTSTRVVIEPAMVLVILSRQMQHRNCSQGLD